MGRVDDYEPQITSFDISLKSSGDAQFNSITHLYIGKNETMREGFVGCISRVEFDEIIPLKLYFQEDHLSNIRASPTTITEDCKVLSNHKLSYSWCRPCNHIYC